MDKRFLLALVLTAVVVIATPLLFRTQSSPLFNTATAPRVGARDSANRVPPLPTVAENPRDSVSPPLATARPDSATTISTAPIVAETTIVSTPLTTYQLSSLGAAPIAVELTSYRALDGSRRNVRLASAAGHLLAYRLFLPGDTVDLSRAVFRVERGRSPNGSDLLTYRAIVAGTEVAIRYAFAPDSYLVRISGEIKSPTTTNGFIAVEMPGNLQSAEADSLDDQQHLAYAVKPQRENARGIPFSKLDPGERRLEAGPITWAAAKNKYFIVGLLTPNGDEPFAEVAVTGGPRTGRNATRASAVAVEPIRNGVFAFELYTGPQEWRRLLALGRDFENSNPYGGFLQGVVQPFATIVMRILLWMRATLQLSYGWVLVIFGVAVRLLLWPLNQKAMKTSMRMSRLQPELSEIQKKYKSDPQRMQAEIMRVYRDHGMSPFSSLSGCLPMLLPMPILFALFFVFQNTIEFRGVPFLWLADISLKDPFYIVPVLMGVSMFVLSIIGMRNSPPNPQAKMMAYVLPVMMTVFFLNLASGLNLYYAIQNITAIPQQWLIANERAKNPATVKGSSTPPTSRG
jgi:YidC/Oxa1 family membrane protein insertase